MGIIYCYTNLKNNKKYIGQTINPESRYKAHKSSAFNEKDQEYNSLFHRAIRKYGFENFKYEVLAESDSVEILNQLEIFFIKDLKSQTPNGYNVLAGGKNSLRGEMPVETRLKLTWPQAKLSEEEIIELRIAYSKKESPKKIYEEKYKDRLHYNSFLNIWSGRRYANIKPELLQKGRHTKANQELADKIRDEYKNSKTSYQKLADKYNLSKGVIASIIQGKTWKSKK